MHCMCKEGPWTLFGSVCVARSVVCVAGRCLVRPEPTFVYPTIGTSAECLVACSFGPYRSLDGRIVGSSTASATRTLSSENSNHQSLPKYLRCRKTIKTDRTACSVMRGTVLELRNSLDSNETLRQVQMPSICMKMTGVCGHEGERGGG